MAGKQLSVTIASAHMLTHHLLILPAPCKQEHLARCIAPTQGEFVALGESSGESGAGGNLGESADFSRAGTIETSCIFEGHLYVFIGFLLFLQPCDSETVSQRHLSTLRQHVQAKSHKIPYCTLTYPTYYIKFHKRYL